MKKINALLAGAALLAALPALALEHAFVAFHELPANIAEEMTLKGVESGRVIPTIRAVSVVAPREVLTAYALDPRVRAVTLQRKLELHTYSSRQQIQASGIESGETHTFANGETVERPGVTGAGITVAIIDSGIFLPHPDFGLPGASRVIAGANFELSLAERTAGVLPTDVWDAYALASGVLALQDEVGHGTHVAGIVGGDGFSASGLDIQGVAPGVNLVSLKIASAGNGVVEDIGFEANSVAAIDYMIRHRAELGNVAVANNSWGLLAEEAQGLLGPTDFDPIKEVVQAAVADGIVMVFSAGNDGPEPDTMRPIPNSMDEVISVASACKADRGSCAAGEMNGFSSRGAAVDVTASGDQIISASSISILEPLGQATGGSYFGDSEQDQLQNRVAYMRISGTSMSAPHVAGVVALILEANPDLNPEEVRQVLIETADDMVIEGHPELLPGFDNASGYGMVNARAAVARAVQLAQAEPEPEAEATARAAGSQAGGALGGGLLLLGLLGIASRRRSRPVQNPA